jgi:hypothetical protein
MQHLRILPPFPDALFSAWFVNRFVCREDFRYICQSFRSFKTQSKTCRALYTLRRSLVPLSNTHISEFRETNLVSIWQYGVSHITHNHHLPTLTHLPFEWWDFIQPPNIAILRLGQPQHLAHHRRKMSKLFLHFLPRN